MSKKLLPFNYTFMVYCLMILFMGLNLISCGSQPPEAKTSELSQVTTVPTEVVATNTPKPLPTDTLTPKLTQTNTPVPPDTATPKPTRTNTPTPVSTNTATPKPMPTNTPEIADFYDSGGLGLSMAQWSLAHEQTGQDEQSFQFGDYSIYLDNKTKNIWLIGRKWQGVPDDIQGIIQSLSPVDSQLVKTVKPPDLPNTTIYVYHSKSLANRFTGNAIWFGSEPGTFNADVGMSNKDMVLMLSAGYDTEFYESKVSAKETAPTATVTPPIESNSSGDTSSAHTFSGEKVDPAWWPCTEGQIKGNRDSMKYHIPTGQFYAKTYEGVECFNTSAEAEAAGYVQSKR